MTLQTKLIAAVVAEHTKAVDLAAGRVPVNLTKSISLDNGTGANQADLIWHDQRTLAASATENLDLAAVLADLFGTTLTFVRVKGLYVAAAIANTNNVLVGGAAANGFITPFGDASDVLVVQPGGAFALFAPGAGYAVTAGTGDQLKLANSAGGTGVTFDIAVIGTSA